MARPYVKDIPLINANTDSKLLARVSKHFTEETLKTIFEKLTGETTATVTGWSFAPGAAKGDNYLSIVYRITVEGIVKENKKSIDIIVKGLPNNVASKKTFRSEQFFENEIYFYTKIVPMYENFLNNKKLGHLLPIPKCLAVHCDGENDFIALEDITARGFNHLSRSDTWCIDAIKSILKGLAHLHAISAACKDQIRSEFEAAASGLKEVFFADKFWNWYGEYYTTTVNIAKDAVSREYNGTLEEKKFLSITPRQLFDEEIRCCSRQDAPTSVILHGDSWAPNFMSRPVNSSSETEAMILDFQMARCASPVLDISFFLYTSTDEKSRKEHFESLLQFYHQEFSNVVGILGSDVNKIYPWSTFTKEVKEQFVHGFCFALEQLPAIVLEESEAFEVENISGNEAVNIAQVWKLKPTIENEKNRKRVADVVLHAIQQGFI